MAAAMGTSANISYSSGSPHSPNTPRINANVSPHSTDGTTFTTVAFGTWIDDNTLKTTVFQPTNGRYMKIQALSEAGNRGPWSSASEINVYTAAQAAPPAASAGKGVWLYTIDFPLVPVSATLEYSSGNLLVWSSYNPSTFGGGSDSQTITATYSPASQLVTSALITNTGHDMFCEGLSMDFTGQVVATGGNTDAATSIYDPPSNAWSKGAVSSLALPPMMFFVFCFSLVLSTPCSIYPVQFP